VPVLVESLPEERVDLGRGPFVPAPDLNPNAHWDAFLVRAEQPGALDLLTIEDWLNDVLSQVFELGTASAAAGFREVLFVCHRIDTAFDPSPERSMAPPTPHAVARRET
jgi:hypothetical protein